MGTGFSYLACVGHGLDVVITPGTEDWYSLKATPFTQMWIENSKASIKATPPS